MPQAQLVYQRIDFDDFTDSFANPIKFDDEDSLEGRLGLAVERDGFDQADNHVLAYADVNVIYEFLNPTSVSIDCAPIAVDQSKTSLEFGGGLNLVLAGDAMTFYVDGDVRVPVDGDGATIVQGTAGLRSNW